ncbi:uncharacterized protein G2W53_014505 [Senna tora]|uniref:Uncharacterized protein n=1 Tax=Senna tora TaxID=362788 RepID=A0A835C867_9FABA|nr:uncharacterized protein G2W53_014505 [Senna tora]
MAWKVCEVMSKHILNQQLRLNIKGIHEVYVKYVVAQVSQTDRFALYLEIRVDLMLYWDSCSHGRKVCEVMPKHILNQKLPLNDKRNQEVPVKRVSAQVSQTDRFALYLGIRANLMLE